MPDQINSEYRIPTSTEERISRANQELLIEPIPNVNQESNSIDLKKEEVYKTYLDFGKVGVDSVIGIKGPETICLISEELYRKARRLQDSRDDKISELNKAA